MAKRGGFRKPFVSRQRKRRDGVYGKYSRKRYIPHFRGGASRKGNYPSSAKRGKKLKKLYEKNELTFALLWIVVYCVLQSLANPLNKRIGVEYSASAAFCILQAVILIAFIRKNHLQKRYGLCKSPVPACRFPQNNFFCPVVNVIATLHPFHLMGTL